MKFILLFMTAITLIAPMILTPVAAQDQKVEPLVLIGNLPITQKDLEERLRSLPTKVREMYEHQQGREELLMEMVRTEIFSREAEAQGLAKDKAVQAMIQDLRKTLLASEYTKRKVLAKAEISEADALRYYELNRDQFTQPEMIKAPSLFIKIPPSSSDKTIKEIQAKAASVLSRARDGEDFAQLARTHSEHPFKDDADFFKRGRLSPDIEETIFALKPGELSPVLEVQDGVIFFKMLDRQPEKALSYAEAKQDLLRDLKEKNINTLFAAEEKRLLARYKVSFQGKEKIEKTADMNTDRGEQVQGEIVEFSAAPKNAEGKSLGTLLIGDKQSDGPNGRVAVIVMPDTIIVKQSTGKERSGSFGDFKIGQIVTVVTQGPRMQSYPPQTRARRITIQEKLSSQ